MGKIAPLTDKLAADFARFCPRKINPRGHRASHQTPAVLDRFASDAPCLPYRRCDFADQAPVGLVVDLSAADAERLPGPGSLVSELCGIKLPRIPVGARFEPLPLVLAALSTRPSADCPKGFGNHISPTIATQ